MSYLFEIGRETLAHSLQRTSPQTWSETLAHSPRQTSRAILKTFKVGASADFPLPILFNLLTMVILIPPKTASFMNL